MHSRLPQLQLVVVPHAIYLLLQRVNLRAHFSFTVALVGFLGGRPELVQIRLFMHILFIHSVKFLPRLNQLLLNTVAAAQFFVQVPMHLLCNQVSRLARLDDG